MKFSATSLLLLLLFCHSPSIAEAQRRKAPESPIRRVDPPFWWTGMADSTLELRSADGTVRRLRVLVDRGNVVTVAIGLTPAFP